MTLERDLHQLRATREQISLEFERETLNGGRISCQRGCASCCHYPLYLSLLEGCLLYQWLMQNRLWTSRAQEKFKEAARQTWGLSLEVWLLSNTPCPLLGERNQCSAYRGRPLYCRTVFSRSDPNNCHPHRFLWSDLVPRHNQIQTWVEEEEALLKKMHLQRTLFPLSVATLYGEKMCNGIDFRVTEGSQPWWLASYVTGPILKKTVTTYTYQKQKRSSFKNRA